MVNKDLVDIMNSEIVRSGDFSEVEDDWEYYESNGAWVLLEDVPEHLNNFFS